MLCLHCVIFALSHGCAQDSAVCVQYHRNLAIRALLILLFSHSFQSWSGGGREQKTTGKSGTSLLVEQTFTCCTMKCRLFLISSEISLFRKNYSLKMINTTGLNETIIVVCVSIFVVKTAELYCTVNVHISVMYVL